jgi:hypothetical protein
MTKLLILFLSVFALAACQTTGTTPVTPESVAAKVCPPTKAVMIVLENSPTVEDKVKEQVRELAPVVAAVCDSGIVPTITNLHDLANQGLPVLLQIVTAAPLSDDQKNYAILSIAIAQAVIATVPK